MDYCVITFTSTYGAMHAQQVMKGLPFLVMPVLREISTGCGISIRFDPPHLAAAQEAMAGCDLKPEEYSFFGITGQGGDLSVCPLT